MKELKERSLALTGKVEVYNPFLNKKRIIDFWHIYSRTYNVQNGILAFKYGEMLYVTKFQESDITKLKNLDYKEMNFKVPFTDCEYPTDELLLRNGNFLLGKSW